MDGSQPNIGRPFSELDERSRLFLDHLQKSEGESDRGLVLFVAAQIDIYLKEILEAFVIVEASKGDLKALFEGTYAPMGSLSARNKLAYMLGLITQEEHEIVNLVKGIRNEFAHAIEANFEHPKVVKHVVKLVVHEKDLNHRNRFLTASVNTAYALVYRPLIVAKDWRRKQLDYFDTLRKGPI